MDQRTLTNLMTILNNCFFVGWKHNREQIVLILIENNGSNEFNNKKREKSQKVITIACFV